LRRCGEAFAVATTRRLKWGGKNFMFPIDYLWRSAARTPTAPALIHPDGVLDYRDLASAVLEQAAALCALNPSEGAMIAVGMESSLEHVLAILAVLAAGKTWVPLNPRNGDIELCRIVDFVQPAIILADRSMGARIASAAGSIPVVDDLHRRNPLSGYPQSHRTVLSGRGLDSTQAIKFTGGSTGRPKGVMQSCRAWNTNIVTQIFEYGLGPMDRYLIAAPLTHGASTYLLPLLGAGGAIIVPESNKPAQLLDAASSAGATITFAPPTLVMALAREQAQHPRRLSLRYLTYAGAAMPPHHVREAQEIFGPIVAASYGQTEAPQIISFMPPRFLRDERLGSVGRESVLTRVAIRTAAGAAAAPGEVGEIVVKGDLTMTGYYRAPEETARVFTDGWLHTGDLGSLDEEGFLFIRGRTRDVIISGGFNVYPADVEAVIASQPAVADCAVVGVPDEKWGEAVHAAIVIRDGHGGQGLAGVLRAALGAVKAPKQIHVFQDLPRTPVGKIDKTAVRRAVLDRLGAQPEPVQ
jgi:fatty-acyl-CoA synthase